MEETAPLELRKRPRRAVARDPVGQHPALLITEMEGLQSWSRKSTAWMSHGSMPHRYPASPVGVRASPQDLQVENKIPSLRRHGERTGGGAPWHVGPPYRRGRENPTERGIEGTIAWNASVKLRAVHGHLLDPAWDERELGQGPSPGGSLRISPWN